MTTIRLPFLLAIASLALGSSVHAQNLITNGNFETGDLTGWTLSYVNPLDIGSDILYYYPANDPLPANWVMDLGSSKDLSTLSQSQPLLTIPNQDYIWRFSLAVDNGTNTDPAASFKVFWNGSEIYNLSNMNASGFAVISGTVTATGTSSDLSFVAQNPASYFELDNVSVMEPVPEPAVWALTVGGLGMLAAFQRMRRKNN